jgi:hypothetical protein
VRLRGILLRYAWLIAFRELMRSPRWTAEQKTTALFLAGALMSFPVVIAIIVWVLTGRGPARKMFTRLIVNPFPDALPPDVRAAMKATRRRAIPA